MSSGKSKAVSGSSFKDSFLWMIVVVIVAAGIYGNSIYAAEYSVLERTLALLALSVVAVLLGLQTVQGRSFWSLVKESRTEIRRVVWPTRPETNQTTLLVVAVVLVMGLILWLLDTVLGYLVSFIIG